MKALCPSESDLLERFFDREVTEHEDSLVRDHLSECVLCREKLSSMGEVRDFLKAPVEEAVGREDFPWVWQNIERGIRLQQRRGWLESLRSSGVFSPFLRKKIWVPAMAALAVLVFFAGSFVLEKSPTYPDSPVVEYVESATHNVMIYQMEKAKMTVIWLFEEPETESSAS
jgi:hypothetical protein